MYSVENALNSIGYVNLSKDKLKTIKSERKQQTEKGCSKSEVMSKFMQMEQKLNRATELGKKHTKTNGISTAQIGDPLIHYFDETGKTA